MRKTKITGKQIVFVLRQVEAGTRVKKVTAILVKIYYCGVWNRRSVNLTRNFYRIFLMASKFDKFPFDG